MHAPPWTASCTWRRTSSRSPIAPNPAKRLSRKMIHPLIPLLLRPLLAFVPIMVFATWGLVLSQYVIAPGLISACVRYASLALCLFGLHRMTTCVWAARPVRRFTPHLLVKPSESADTRSECKKLAKSLRKHFDGNVPKFSVVPARHENREILHVIWQHSCTAMSVAFVVDRDGAGAVEAFPHPKLYSVRVMSDAMLIVHAIQAIAWREHPWQFDSPTPPRS
jgi:hypothetical protein